MGFHPKLFVILAIKEQQKMTKRQLGKELHKFIERENLMELPDEGMSHILVNTRGQLTKLTGNSAPVLPLWNNGQSLWWPFVTQVYNRWRV